MDALDRRSTHSALPPFSASQTSTSSQRAQASGQPIPTHRFATLCATVDSPDSQHKDRFGSSSVPIYQSSTFKGIDGQYDYTRSGNPSRTFLQHHVAKISSAKHAFAVNTGMAALDVILRTLKPGDEIIAGNDLYGGSNRLLHYINEHNGIITHHIDTTNLDVLQPFLVKDSKVRMVLLESPTNPLLQIVDIQEIIHRVKEVIPDALIVVDNTMMSPYLMKPLQFGADIVYDSGTKFLSGHHDLMAGLIICDDDRIAQKLAFIINSIGNGLAPFECFLLIRGIKTLSLRLDRQQATAIRVAKYLDRLGFKVHYPGLPKHKGKQIHDRLARGPGAVLSFETCDKKLSEKIVSLTQLWSISVSFGCVNSLISMPCLMSHASIDPAVRAARKLPEDLIRLCVGIEDPEDLIRDLQTALLKAGAIRVLDETIADSGFERANPSGLNTPKTAQMVPHTKSLDFLQNPATLLVSAPGKIILFGEHAVVYGKKAIAAAVNLRCYCLVEPNHTQVDTVTLSLPDSDWLATWFLDELPWDIVALLQETDKFSVDSQLSKILLSKASSKADQTSLIQAAHAFLYLFMCLAANQNRRSQVFTVRSTLPVGAGLGSSAAYSVCLATALLYSHQHIGIPGQQKIEQEDTNFINRWAFVGEKILHGSPSGVDNTVSSFGGAICFKKEVADGGGLNRTDKKTFEKIRGFGSIKILITDTKIPRDTKSLVASVAQRKKEEPDYIQKILDGIESITNEARESILKLESNQGDEEGLNGEKNLKAESLKHRHQIIQRLGELMDSNHSLLSSLGVSHEKLELVKGIAANNPDGLRGLKTKLTGAGGGGCAISLVPDGFNEVELRKIILELEGLKMKTYETSVGVNGVGILLNGSNTECTRIKQIFLQSDLNYLNKSLIDPFSYTSSFSDQHPHSLSKSNFESNLDSPDSFWHFS